MLKQSFVLFLFGTISWGLRLFFFFYKIQGNHGEKGWIGGAGTSA